MMNDIKIRSADETFGYKFGCDGVMDAEEARAFLGNISWSTLQRLTEDGAVRKGKIPGGKKTVYCRRSIVLCVEGMEV